MKHGGILVARDKLFRLFLFIAVLPAVILVRLIKPFIVVRFAVMPNQIGGLSANVEIFLAERDLALNQPSYRCLDLFAAPESIPNLQLFNMWKQVVRIWPYFPIGVMGRLNRLLPGGLIHQHPITKSTPQDYDVNNVLDKTPVRLKFSAEEIEIATQFLRKLGLRDGQKFVCLLVRDQAYLSHCVDEYANEHRNIDVNNYVLAVSELLSRGYFVFRMGARVSKAMDLSHPNFIDYGYLGIRTELMDVYLAAKCEFCVTTGSGWDGLVSHVFRKPVVYTNIVPVGYISTSSDKFIVTTRKVLNCQTGQFLSLSEIFQTGLGYCYEYAANSHKWPYLKMISNTPEEILSACVEMDERIKGEWNAKNGDVEAQHRFWEIFRKMVSQGPFPELHKDIRARISSEFLRENPEFLR